MADNIELNAGTGGATAATDDVGGVHFQKVKIDVGGDGASALLSNSNPVPVSDAGGALTVDGTVAVTHAALTELGTALVAEDVGHSSGDLGLMGLTVRQDAAAALGQTDADYQPLITDGSGLLWVNASGAAVPVTDNGGALTVDGTVTANLGATDNAVLDSIDAAVNGTLTVSGTVDLGATDNAVLDAIAASLALLDNSIAAGNELQVDIVAMPNVTLAAGTNTNEVVGDVAHDAGVGGNPVQIGGYATNNIEGVTQVAAGDLTRQVHDLNGVQVMRPHTTLEEIQTVRTTNTDGASTSLISAAGAGVHNYVTHVTIWNSSATDGFVDFRDGTAGAVIHTFPAPQTGGCTVAFNPPLKFGDNTAVAYDASGAISTIYISAVYFQAQG